MRSRITLGNAAGSARHAHALRYSADTEPRLASVVEFFKDEGAVIVAKVERTTAVKVPLAANAPRRGIRKRRSGVAAHRNATIDFACIRLEILVTIALSPGARQEHRTFGDRMNATASARRDG